MDLSDERDAVSRAIVTVGLGGREHELRPGGKLAIGRHERNDVVIPRPDISRFHAEIRWPKAESRPHVVDLGSQNGTTLDGEPVRWPSRLRDGQTVGVGEEELAVRLPLLIESSAPALLKDSDEHQAARLFTEQGEAKHGRLETMDEIGELLRSLEIKRRTGTLTLQLFDDFQLVFVSGRMLVDAEESVNIVAAALEQISKGGSVGYVYDPEVAIGTRGTGGVFPAEVLAIVLPE